jgi:hypothetical protein
MCGTKPVALDPGCPLQQSVAVEAGDRSMPTRGAGRFGEPASRCGRLASWPHAARQTRRVLYSCSCTPGIPRRAWRSSAFVLVHRLRRPSAARARPGGRAVGRSTALSAGAPRVVRVCVLQFQKIQPHRVVADGAHRVVCVQKRVTGWSRRTSPSSGRSSPSVSALPVLLSLFCVSPPCASIALNASELLVMCRAEKGRGSTHEGKIPR